MIELRKNIVIEGSKGRPILLDLYPPEKETPAGAVVFAHGFKGFKDWGAWDLVAQQFSRSGFFFVKFNFSHNGGTVQQPVDFPDLEAFGNNNYSKELEDLDRVLKWVAEHSSIASAASTRLGLIGHSRGGGMSLIKTAEDSRIHRLATWAAVADFGALFPDDEQIEKWRNAGVTYIENSRTGQQMPLYFQFYEDFQAHRERFDLSRAVARISVPLLIVHGTEDETVPLEHARTLHGWCPRSKLLLVEGAGHTFGAVHPWTDSLLPEHLKQGVQETIRFFSEYAIKVLSGTTCQALPPAAARNWRSSYSESLKTFPVNSNRQGAKRLLAPWRLGGSKPV